MFFAFHYLIYVLAIEVHGLYIGLLYSSYSCMSAIGCGLLNYRLTSNCVTVELSHSNIISSHFSINRSVILAVKDLVMLLIMT